MGNQPAKLDDASLEMRTYLEVNEEELQRVGASVAVSHHPADRETAVRLNNALSNAGRRVLVRWDEKEPEATPELLDKTHRAIEAMDCFVALVSPAYLASELCRWELEHAVRCGKRVIPVEAQSMSDDAGLMPPALRERNAVFMTPSSDFDAGVRLLTKLLDRDVAHLRQHTLIVSRAVAWESVHARNRRMLLRGDDKRRALAFLDRAATGTAPFPNSLALDYLFTTFQRAQRPLRGAGARPPPSDALVLACSAYTQAALRPPEGAASIFVSFAPEDAEFARELVAALRERLPQRRVYARFEDAEREATKELRDAINSDIQEAEAFLFVISPESLTSEASAWDLDHATRCAKRLVPVVARQVDLRTIPAELVDVKWIFFDGGLGSFDVCVANIAERCDGDLPHLQYHSRLLAYAVLWVQNSHGSKYLLRGADVRSALEWAMAAALGKGPFPTRLHLDFLTASSGRPSLWMAGAVPEVCEVASLPPDARLPALCRKEWVTEVEASEAYMREGPSPAAAAAQAAAAAAAQSDAEVSVFEPQSSLESLVDLAGGDGGDGDEDEDGGAAAWAPVNTVRPLYASYSHDPENEEAFIDSLEEELRNRGDVPEATPEEH